MSAPVLFLPGPDVLACCDYRRPLHAAPSITNLGNSITVPANWGTLITVADLQAKCTLGEMLAVVVGLECAPDCPVLPPVEGQPVDAIVLPRVYITWSLGGASFTAALDARNGMIVNVPADSVKVQAVVLAFTPDGVDPSDVATPRPIRFSAGFAYGAGNIREAARLTQPVFVPAGEIQSIPIPPFASGFALVPLGGSSLTAQVRTDGGMGPFPTYTAIAPTESVTGFPLMNGARCITIDNTGGSSTVQGFVVFALDL